MTRRSSTRRAGATLLAAAGLVLLAAPAAAHPFGEPPHADLTVDGDTVTLTWQAASDDLAELAVDAGLLDDDAPQAILDGDNAAIPDEAARDELAADPQFRRYLTDRLEVTADGRRCAGELTVVGDPLEDPLRYDATCPAPPGTVTVEIGLLTDLDPAYRTYLFADDLTPDVALHTVEAPRHTFTVDADTDDGVARGPAVAAALLAAASIAGVAWWRRRD